MKRRLAYYGIIAGALLGLLCMAAIPAAAQEGKASESGAAKAKPQAMPKGGPAPRAADGHPELSKDDQEI